MAIQFKTDFMWLRMAFVSICWTNFFITTMDFLVNGYYEQGHYLL